MHVPVAYRAPLAMPGLAGAGTFAVIMSLSSQASARPGFDRVLDFTAVLLAIVIVRSCALPRFVPRNDCIACSVLRA